MQRDQEPLSQHKALLKDLSILNEKLGITREGSATHILKEIFGIMKITEIIENYYVKLNQI